MGRRKPHPCRSKGVLSQVLSCDGRNQSIDLEDGQNLVNNKVIPIEGLPKNYGPFLVKVDQDHSASDQHFDIAEIVLKDAVFSNEYPDWNKGEDFCKKSGTFLLIRLSNVDHDCFRLSHWPILSADTIFLELVTSNMSADQVTRNVILSGTFDGPDEGVSGLVHLVNLKIFSLRPVMEGTNLTGGMSFRMRVELLRSAFDTCNSLLEVPRQLWRKSMMSAMSWLRPEVTTSEAKYRISLLDADDLGKYVDTAGNGSRKKCEFDINQFYEAIKPSKVAPKLENKFPDLLPELRPYQRRACYWMVQQEKGFSESSEEQIKNELIAPLCVPIFSLDGHSRMFYNPFCGSFSLHPETVKSRVSGGILADEMGLGKTVELLACIFANPDPNSGDKLFSDTELADGHQMKRVKRERVECICGAVAESYHYKGLWVQCDICDAWQHADCVGYLPKKKTKLSEAEGKAGAEEIILNNSKRRTTTKYYSNIVEMDGEYVCSLCSELAEATNTTITSCATLIVCPAPILMQWYSEIIRHTRPGSLRVHIYEGAKNLAPSSNLTDDVKELATADIVLTTYDVLKEDLSHDSDRHDGDRRFMRFQKRYPVVPTFLTRIHWWRLCLDEAQMVESNTTAVTEMALRLRSRHRWCITGTPIQRRFDDIYGLLHFLGARPFDIYKWWSEVIRDPYERRDAMAIEFTHSFFKQIMWRSSKAHVSDELGLPPQEDSVSWLRFSAVEEHFYRKQHETCISCAQELIDRFKEDFLRKNNASGFDASCGAFLSHSEAAKLLTPLLKIRQACCHPQVGSSGIRSLQQSPMTMDEILDVLISKTKIEGEEALRRIVVSLNGLAAIAIIENEHDKAISLYKEALSTAKDNLDDFRLDPLLSLHIHHNLADLLPGTSECPTNSASSEPVCETPGEKANDSCGQMPSKCYVSGQGVREGRVCCSDIDGHLLDQHAGSHVSSGVPTIGLQGEEKINVEHGSLCQTSCVSLSICNLRHECETIKKKYLSVFIARLSVAQQDFKNSNTQVLHMFKELKSHHESWWLQILVHVEQNNELVDSLIKKIDQSVSVAAGNSGSSRAPLRYRSIGGLKYSIQTGLDSLETSRNSLLERLMQIDQTMEKPNEEDIGRVRSCPSCQAGDGPLCIHCELDGLFQGYEARLFRLKKGNSITASAEEALALQNKRKELNLFFRDRKISASAATTDTDKGQRHISTNVVVSRSPSDLEVILGVMKNYSKSHLGREVTRSASKQLLLFEAMRKEFVHARSLSTAQAQLFRAHDEIKMSTSRLRLKISEHEPAASNILSKGELIPSSLQFSNDKFMSLSLLARINGQLRYLKGLLFNNQVRLEHLGVQSLPKEENISCTPTAVENSLSISGIDVQPCPICHDKLGDQKMMFQCGHVTCCKCFLELTEQVIARSGKCGQKWVMCPTCRQHTDFGNVAYVDDSKSEKHDMVMTIASQDQNISETCIKVQGSYGTKIEAVTRRILWIRSTDHAAKVIVFSSWNDVLDVLEHAFHANGISFVRMKGGRKSQIAIARFKGQAQSNPEGTGEGTHQKEFIQVLLLLMQHGANGLNLLEAQHVILVEPLLNPAMEAQAINRVHRIGQDKKTYVHRFMIKNTVEESIYKLNRSRAINTIISPKSRHQDQPSLTLKDVETLFSPIAPKEVGESEEHVETGSLMHLPPSVSAGLAAERRLMESSRDST